MNEMNNLLNTSPAPEKADTNKFDKYLISILTNLWNPGNSHLRVLDYKATFYCPVKKFISHIENEEYPHTYQDFFLLNGKRYAIYYLFTSGNYLDELADDKPTTPIAFQLRVNSYNKFFACLVRKWDQRWSKDFLHQHGAVEFQGNGEK